MKWILAFFFSFFAMTCFAAENVQMSVDANNIVQGQSFTVNYVYTGPFQEFNPNLEAFEKDFIVYGKNISAEMTIVNGVSNMNTQLVLTLIPKRSGKVVIPGVRFAKGISDEMTVTIKEASDVPLVKSDRSAFLEAAVDPKSQFVQAQVNYSIKLFYATNLANSSLTDPIVEDAVVMRTDNDKQYQTTNNKQRYQVLERNYAIFPQKSGPLIIKSPVFTGIEQKDALSFNGLNNLVMNANGKPVRFRAKDLTIEVKPMLPSGQGQPWLPAKKLELSEAWSKVDGKLKVGDPINRTLIISATGLTADQLPDLGHENLPDMNVYPDKAVTQNTLQGGDIVGQRQEKIAYIPTKAGQIELPSVQVTWYDVVNQVERVALVPSRTLTIEPGLDAQQATPAPVQPVEKVVETQAEKPVVENESHGWAEVPMWIWLVSLFAVAWIITMIAWIATMRMRAQNGGTKKEKAATLTQQQASKRRLINDIHSACIGNQGKKVRDAMLQWAKLQWPDKTIHNLAMLADWVGEGPLHDELLGLDESLYGHKPTQWFGQSLWTEFSQFKGRAPETKTVNYTDLPPLYPS